MEIKKIEAPYGKDYYLRVQRESVNGCVTDIIGQVEQMEIGECLDVRFDDSSVCKSAKSFLRNYMSASAFQTQLVGNRIKILRVN